MKKFFLLGGFFTLASIVTVASAQLCNDGLGVINNPFSGFYLSLLGGYTNFNLDLKRPNVPGLEKINDSSLNISGYTVTPSLGYDFFQTFNLPFRIEVAANYYGKVSWTKNPVYQTPPSGNIGNTTVTDSLQANDVLANFYFDYHNVTPFTPFIGIGAGVADISTKHTYYSIYSGSNHPPYPTHSGTDSNFAWNVIGGVSYQATANISLLTEVNYTDLGKANFYTCSGHSSGCINYFTNPLKAYNVLIGARYSF